MIPVNPSSSPAVGGQVRPADRSDQQKIADLIFFESHVHRHLDWRTPLDWLGFAPYWLLDNGRQITAALACPPDPDSIAWIRLFAFASSLSAYSAWTPLWESALRQLSESGGAVVAAIATQHWFNQLLQDNHFEPAGHIVLLEWLDGTAGRLALSRDVHVRAMTRTDLPRVAEIDCAAFEPLWRNSLAALEKAFEQASYASVAERDSRIIGYQLSTGGSFGAHLARLAVLPEYQGRGTGAALVVDLILHTQSAGGSKVTVNTQDGNAASLALYGRLGFHRTGEQFPVYTHHVK